MSDNSTVHREAFWLLAGQQLGVGMSRKVYVCDLDREWVLKVEDDAGRFQNVMEWETWQAVKGTQFEKWFAPCHHISPSGSVLVMARTTPAVPAKYPKRMPVFLSDFKRSNYGLYKGRIVCHDYGTNLLMDWGKTTRLRAAHWSDS